MNSMKPINRKARKVEQAILAVTDEGTPRLTSYRRIVLHVRALPAASVLARK